MAGRRARLPRFGEPQAACSSEGGKEDFAQPGGRAAVTMASIGRFVAPCALVLCVFPSLKTRFVGWPCVWLVALAAAAAKRDSGKRGGRREFTKANQPQTGHRGRSAGGAGSWEHARSLRPAAAASSVELKWEEELRLL